MCKQQGCKVPGSGSAYRQDLQRLAAFRERHRRRLPSMVWMDTPPQHFPGTGDWAGKPWGGAPQVKHQSRPCWAGLQLERWQPRVPVAQRYRPGRFIEGWHSVRATWAPNQKRLTRSRPPVLAPPAHCPAGSFRAKSCEPHAGWERGDAVARAGGTWNVAAAPLVGRLADAHLSTWNASVGLWDMHMPGECTHSCQPSAYHLWLYLLNGVLRDSGLGRPASLRREKGSHA